METNSYGSATQGVDQPTADLPPSFDLKQVEKWLTRDLGICIVLLSAIHNDPNLRRMMALHLHGLHENKKAQDALKNQATLFAEDKLEGHF